MKRKILILLACVMICAAVALPAAADSAAEAVPFEEGLPCFSGEELEARPELAGVFLTGVPEDDEAVVCLGTRVLRAGDAVVRSDLLRLRVRPGTAGRPW